MSKNFLVTTGLDEVWNFNEKNYIFTVKRIMNTVAKKFYILNISLSTFEFEINY